MLKRTKDGSTVRKHLEAAARIGDAAAAAELEGPECPEEAAYLVDWFWELWYRSGVGMAGPAPLSHRELDAWARLTRTDPDPLEVWALMQLDAAAMDDSEAPKEEAEPAPRAAEAPAWPAKKRPTINDSAA